MDPYNNDYRHIVPLRTWVVLALTVVIYVFLISLTAMLAWEFHRLEIEGVNLFQFIAVFALFGLIFKIWRTLKVVRGEKKKFVPINVIYNIIITILVVVFIIAPFGGVYGINELMFNQRIETQEFSAKAVEEFDGLIRERRDFETEDGVNLAGFLYEKGNGEKRGTVIVVHGLGAGHVNYTDLINFFAENDYYVFSYDAKGNDLSDGEGVGGIPQGVVDLEHAIEHVKSFEEVQGLPLSLVGHSWGAYSALAVLAFEDVDKVIALSGFNDTLDMWRYQGSHYVGETNVGYVLPYISVFQEMIFGEEGITTGVEGVTSSNAEVFIVQGGEDDIVPQSLGYDILYEALKAEEGVTFLFYPERGHNDIYYSDLSREHRRELDEGIQEVLTGTDPQTWDQLIYDYYEKYGDKELFFDLDDELPQEMLTFLAE